MELAPCSFSCSYSHCSIGFTPRVRAGSKIRAEAHQGSGGGEGAQPGRTTGRLAADGPPVVTVPAVAAEGPGGFGAREAEHAMWEKLGAVVRLSYGIGKQ